VQPLSDYVCVAGVGVSSWGWQYAERNLGISNQLSSVFVFECCPSCITGTWQARVQVLVS